MPPTSYYFGDPKKAITIQKKIPAKNINCSLLEIKGHPGRKTKGQPGTGQRFLRLIIKNQYHHKLFCRSSISTPPRIQNCSLPNNREHII
ncbi:hypothetical protein CEXT_300521 [Caerostris extrusa]|uniref:Uncharacterized protein n=1 Tax=Caerostris extrusa TaxID=172846 RepID=A0AAV4MT62_CAEEX|nr:hypothetical protein CEXT_300521 [Caerostris extrusa]